MKQIIYGGFWAVVVGVAPAPRYAMLKGSVWSDSSTSHKNIVTTPGTIRKFKIKLVDADGDPESSGEGCSITFKVRKNYTDTDISVTISDAETEGNDYIHEAHFDAGDVVDLSVTRTSFLNLYARWVTEFEGDNAKESVVFGGGGTFRKDHDYYACYAGYVLSITEANVEQIVAAGGVIKNLYVELSRTPDANPTERGYDFTLRVNGEDTSLTCSILGTDTTAHDTAHEVAVSAGDIVTLKGFPTDDAPPYNAIGYYGTTFKATTDGESLLPNGNIEALNVSATRYQYLAWNMYPWATNEFEKVKLALTSKLSHLYMKVSAAPGTGKSWTFTVRKNGADTSLKVTITGANITGSNIINEVALADDDEVDIKCEPVGGPAAAHAHWGLRSGIMLGAYTQGHIIG